MPLTIDCPKPQSRYEQWGCIWFKSDSGSCVKVWVVAFIVFDRELVWYKMQILFDGSIWFVWNGDHIKQKNPYILYRPVALQAVLWLYPSGISGKPSWSGQLYLYTAQCSACKPCLCSASVSVGLAWPARHPPKPQVRDTPGNHGFGEQTSNYQDENFKRSQFCFNIHWKKCIWRIITCCIG